MLRQILFLFFAVFILTVQCRSLRDSKCLEPITPGPCYGHLNRAAFDTTKNTCVHFVYGGCMGNGNQFDSLESCEEICGVRK